ncbi:unnamed protein product, partial [Prorocentrum cordatum]
EHFVMLVECHLLHVVALIMILGAVNVTFGHPLRLRGSMQIFVKMLTALLMPWVQLLRIVTHVVLLVRIGSSLDVLFLRSRLSAVPVLECAALALVTVKLVLLSFPMKMAKARGPKREPLLLATRLVKNVLLGSAWECLLPGA